MTTERMVITTVLAVSLAALPLAACSAQGGANSTDASGNTNNSQGQEEQVANPWEDCSSLEEAESVAGFQASMPSSLDGYGEAAFQAIQGETIQAIYGDTTDSSSPVACMRKSLGEGQDVSGDYNDYPDAGTIDVEGMAVSLRGSSGSWSVATWSHDDYSYAITLTDAQDESWFISAVGSVS